MARTARPSSLPRRGRLRSLPARYGPPGTGKTLIARQIGKMLNGKEPKIVNGPEILSKYVGQARRRPPRIFEYSTRPARAAPRTRAISARSRRDLAALGAAQSEENIRALFSDAEAEYKERGDDSELHIIIFDEIDSICKQRGSSRDGTG